MTVMENVYNDLDNEKSLHKKIKKIKKYKPVRGIYVITLPLFNHGLLEIYDFNELTQPFYRKYDREYGISIVGISASRGGAKSLACDIVAEIYENTGDFDTRGVLPVSE